MGAILVVGSLNMDLVVRAARHPAPGETVLGEAFQTFPGGKGANQAVAAARLATTPVRMIGRVGADAFGEALVTGLAADGVATTWVQRDAAAPTGVALITLDQAGQNTIVVAPGANARLTPEDVEAAAAAFEGVAVVVVQLEIPLATVARAITLAHARGARVLLNPAPAQPLPAAMLAAVDDLLPNQTELAQLTGEADYATAARQLLGAGVGRVVVTLGGEGVCLFDGEGRSALAAHPVTVVDTTAAGDAFTGAYAAALAEGRPAREALAWGNAAGALAVTRAGAQPALPTRREVEALLAGAR